MKTEIVAEIEGEYGPLTISERLVQKIWTRGEFRQTDLRTLEGRTLEILDRGKWNLLAGPDFKSVSIKVDGELLNGDAELHFFDSDWEAHGHESDPAFQNVILHILVFPPKKRTRPVKCFIDHSLLLLDLLPQGLESYAEEEVIGALTAGEETVLEELLLSLPMEERLSKLATAAEKRWKGKVRFAQKRIKMLGWEEACHQTALEILGYRYNRAAMLFLAGDYSLRAMRSGNHSVSDIYEAGQGRWRVSGTRPANHPKQRLAQYLKWVGLRPKWPEELGLLGKSIPDIEGSDVFNHTRKRLGLSALKDKISRQVLADSVGGTRIENLVCDGFLPLLTAYNGQDLFHYWYHWFSGDVPSALKRVLRSVGGRASKPGPSCNGGFQGLLRCMLENQAPIKGN